MENMSENALDVLNRIETTPKSDISTKPKKITKKKIQNASFFFIYSTFNFTITNRT